MMVRGDNLFAKNDFVEGILVTAKPQIGGIHS